MTYFAQRHQSCTYCILWQFVRLSKASFICLFLKKLVATVLKPCLTTTEKERLVALNRGRENLFISPARKVPLVELKPTGPHEATKPASFNDLVKAMTEAFKLSVAKPSTSTSDPIGRSISLNQPKPYSLGKKFHVMVIGIRGILKACWHYGTEDGSVYDFLITLLEQPAYRALQLLRIPESTSYQGFLKHITTRFDSGKSTGACKMLIRARRQKQSVCWKAVGTGRKRLLWCRLSIQRRTCERPVLKGSSRSL